MQLYALEISYATAIPNFPQRLILCTLWCREFFPNLNFILNGPYLLETMTYYSITLLVDPCVCQGRQSNPLYFSHFRCFYSCEIITIHRVSVHVG